ncbi:response regulator transcription factor [Marinovum sp. SP66]|jgi:DNA-binding NarL/FixJ family response regulator|uniref:response regulator transcription factor n=1 Tax=Marinovum TaxID=367771 RepID=UPI00065B0E3E|nr:MULTISPECIES: response regulator transcription factor [unclassified Marinovum]AKO97440.1 Response regulator [Marinovum algicola DG 898]MDD9738529.1 response regulator transcription factor [Marinovum sp. SP66]MDD9744357.1 response regulator transcription factor [Marinovum sp. PR37]
MTNAPQTPINGISRALVIDDHPLFCDALVLTLRALCVGARVETAASLDEGLTRVAETGSPDIVLLDLNLPDVNGLDGLLRLRAALGQNSPVIVVSSMADNRTISKALAAGAAAFVPKHSQKPAFHKALSAVRKGQVYTPEDYLPDADEQPQENDAMERLSTLTNQQSRILQLICEGKLNKQIAYDLSIAETTVKAHVTAIMRKLGVQSRTQAVLVAQDARLGGGLPDHSQHA